MTMLLFEVMLSMLLSLSSLMKVWSIDLYAWFGEQRCLTLLVMSLV